ncbi:RagB/SusD family nutrient uptake outer membrane protein [Anaerorudis cellulosivorans]|uniref:RagB/SusD family nutrient uptake outer membrane protein n=1 Tax=Anaerorudis cellulosivorans TaxID=3397862 RepID=UPI00221EBF2E|nr:RagB/SusD family nutrient uptake outer membrane protein [Seramator thermalis]MCW1734762.1 RagB/SusD family nutrient uptake outer membrane protein [Seramator thermalis]
MKKYLFYLCFILIGIFIGCSDFLDKQPDDMKTDEMVWSSRTEVERYLANVYAALPINDRLERETPWVGCADECDLSWAVYNTYPLNLGNWTPSSDLYTNTKYPLYYRAIRSSFVFENNVDRCPELSNDLKKQYKAEAKFLRGYYYWMLLRQYGPVILIKEQLANDAPWTEFMRSPFDDCVDYICKLMDEAEQDLPLHYWDNTSWMGKPTKIACKATKSQVLTYAASPQWNGNKEYANFKNPDGTPLANITYDENKWRKAAQASKAVIDIAEQHPEAILRLYKNNEQGGEFNPYISCMDVHLIWNSEIIFGSTNGTGNATAWMIHCSPGPKNLGGVGPTQRLVDAFLMENGKPIEDPESGYVATGFAQTPGKHWNPNNRAINTEEGRKQMIGDIRRGDAWGHWAGEWNMYANREPRFYVSILYNKRIIPEIPDDINKRNFYNSPGQKDGYARAELYYGGVSRQSGSYTFYSRTGYLAHKRVDQMANLYDRIYPQQYTKVYIRYAEILLNYIEALNEYDPSNPDIRKYWDMIRERAGVPSAFLASPQIKGNKDLQREFILRERQIELCLEGDRYFTTRRRWLAHIPDEGGSEDYRKYGDGGRIWGMDVNAGDPQTNNFSFTGFYNVVPVETRVFNKAFYISPIPQTEIDKSENLVQNPWW